MKKILKKVGAKNILISQPDKVKVFLEGIKLGQTIHDSCEYANISTSSVYDWVARGERDKENDKQSIYVEFLESFNRAKQQFIRNALYHIFQAAKSDWKAAAYLLKMRHPKDYSDKKEYIEEGEETPEAKTFAEQFMEALDEKTGR